MLNHRFQSIHLDTFFFAGLGTDTGFGGLSDSSLISYFSPEGYTEPGLLFETKVWEEGVFGSEDFSLTVCSDQGS